jgi:hypothetical protein
MSFTHQIFEISIHVDLTDLDFLKSILEHKEIKYSKGTITFISNICFIIIENKIIHENVFDSPIIKKKERKKRRIFFCRSTVV